MNPFLGAVRVAQLLAIMRTPFRFRTKRISACTAVRRRRPSRAFRLARRRPT